MHSLHTLSGLCKSVLSAVSKLSPSAHAAVSVSSSHRAHTRFARNAVTTSGENDELSLTLTVQLGLRTASATTNQMAPATLQQLAQRTLANARLAPEIPETMPLLGPQAVVASALHDPAMARLDAVGRAKGIARALEPSRSLGLLSAGYLEVHDELLLRMTSQGLVLSQPSTDAHFSMTARTADGTGSGWKNLATRQLASLDFDRVGQVAAQKARASAQPKSIEPGRYTVVLEPAAVGELFEYLVEALDRRAVDEGRSALVGKQDHRIASELITLRSDPRTCAMMPFDSEGFPLQPRTWVDRGVLKDLHVSRYWAKHKSLPPTGNYDGFEVLAGDTAFDQLFQGIKRGVLITRLWYSNLVDPQTLLITGLTRDGTFLIEDGAIAGAIKNFRINQSVIEALSRVDAVSSDRESPQVSSWKLPAMRTHDFLLASTSDAV